VELRLELALDATAQQLKELVAAVKIVLQKTDIENTIVFLIDTGKNAHIISVEYFTTMQQSLEDFNALREAVNFEVIELMEKTGVELAAANTEVVIKPVKN
jgi:MscS family membrane protein